MGKGKRCKSVRRANKNNLDNITVQDKSIANSLLRRKTFWAIIVLALSIIPVAIFLYSKLSASNNLIEAKPVSVQNSSSQLPLVGLPKENKSEFAKPTDVSTETVFMLPAELEKSPNTAKINLLCAQGLNGSENLDVDKCLKTIDEWAAFVKRQTARNFHRFKENPKEYYNSEAYFRMGMLITFLQQDFGVKYNMNLAAKDKVNWTDARDSKYQFLHGLLTGSREGTCASMPVLYLVIGRKLGYPLSLVCAKRHIFLRWEDSKERINIEGSGHGMSTHSDEYYRDWLKFTKEDNEFKYYLKSLSPTEEYALFLEFRADILGYNGNSNEAKRIFEKALEYVPNHPLIKERLKEIQSIKNNAILAQAEHKKTDYRREQLESINLVNQAQFRLAQTLSDKLDAVNKKYLSINNPNESSPKQIQARMFQQTQEQSRIRFEHDMKMSTLQNWKNQAMNGGGAPITQQQIDLLEGKHNTIFAVSPQELEVDKVNQEYRERQQTQFEYNRKVREEQRRQEQGDRYRPSPTFIQQPDFAAQEKMQRQIINANNARLLMEENQRIGVQSGFTNFNNMRN